MVLRFCCTKLYQATSYIILDNAFDTVLLYFYGDFWDEARLGEPLWTVLLCSRNTDRVYKAQVTWILQETETRGLGFKSLWGCRAQSFTFRCSVSFV